MSRISLQRALRAEGSGSSITNRGVDNTFLTFYLPASGAGSPSISPAFDTNFWTNTGSAVRVVGRIGKKYGTSRETISTTSNNPKSRVLIRQFIIPLAHIGLFHPNKDNWLYFSTYCIANVGTSDATIHPIFIWAILDASGAIRNPALTQGSISFTAGSTTMVGSGFTSGDVGREFIVENRDNIQSSGDPGVNTIAAFTNSTHVVIGNSYPVGSDVPGSGRTIRYVSDNGRGALQYGAGIGVTANTLTGGAQHQISLADRAYDRTDYLLIEIGFQPVPPAGNPTRSYRLIFGDPSDDTVFTNLAGGSSGGYPDFGCVPFHIGS